MMWGIFLGALVFIGGFVFAPIGYLVSAFGLTLALVATARYAVELLTDAGRVSLTARKTMYDDIGHEPPPLSAHVPGTPLP